MECHFGVLPNVYGVYTMGVSWSYYVLCSICLLCVGSIVFGSIGEEEFFFNLMQDLGQFVFKYT